MSIAAEERVTPRLLLRLQLLCGAADGFCSIPLQRVHQITGYARLTGEPDDYFLGWLTFHHQPVPVFDLNRIVCDQPTPESFGSRILLLETPPGAPTRLLGLVASGVTDTVEADAADLPPPLELNSYLPMLYTLIPQPPVAA